ncbi:MAG: hypothetical protein ACYCT9_00355 [Leptospirillum sp.]
MSLGMNGENDRMFQTIMRHKLHAMMLHLVRFERFIFEMEWLIGSESSG